MTSNPSPTVEPTVEDIEEARRWLGVNDQPSVEDLASFRAEARTVAEGVADKLRVILLGAPDWNCDPSNDCYQECCRAWLKTAEEAAGSPPKHMCRGCKSGCLPFQIFDNLCRWCALRQARSEERDRIIRRIWAMAYPHLADRLRREVP